MEYQKRKKVFIRLDEIASAEYIPYDEPSYGLIYTAHIIIQLKAGGKIKVTYGDADFDRLIKELGFDK